MSSEAAINAADQQGCFIEPILTLHEPMDKKRGLKSDTLSAMKNQNRFRFVLLTASLASFGAGCFAPTQSPSIAEPLVANVAEQPVQKNLGFGNLPRIQLQPSRARVTLASPVPELPVKITVLRPQRGTPNQTELRNVLNALSISDAAAGLHPTVSDLTLRWTDDQRVQWSYTGSERLLEFTDQSAPNEPVTVASLPTADAMIRVASSFLLERGIRAEDYGTPYVDPDWMAWWERSSAAGKCVDAASLATIRATASSAPFLIGRPPILSDAKSTHCLSTEFPTRHVVHFPAMADGRAIVRADGSILDGASVLIDASRLRAVGGRITLQTDSDRSDYPSLTAEEAAAQFLAGGISGPSGTVTLSSYAFAQLRVTDTKTAEPTAYLIPSLVASGFRIAPDGTSAPIRIVVPLLK